MKKLLSILCAAAMLTASAGAVYADNQNTADTYIRDDRIYEGSTNKFIGIIDEYLTNADSSSDWVYDSKTKKTLAVKCEYVPDDTYTKGDWIYDSKTNKIVDYCGKGGNIVVPDNTTVSKLIHIFLNQLEAHTCGKVSVENVTIGENVTLEGEFFTWHNNRIKSIIFNNSIEQVPESNLNFYCYSGLEKIRLPKGIKTISNKMFSECYALKTIENLDDVTSIGNNSFTGCNSLETFTIPKNLKSIGRYTISGDKITSVVIPESVTAKFSYDSYSIICDNLKSFTFGDNIDFRGLCSPYSLEEINYSGKEDVYELLKHFKYTKWAENYYSSLKNKGEFCIDNGTLLKYNGEDKAPVIPDTVKTIGYEAFSGSDITSVTIPEGVTAIDEQAFGRCESLVSVTIPASVKTIGKESFYGCKSLSSITVNGTPYIMESAFMDTALTGENMNLKEGFRYQGIEEKFYGDKDPMIYFYPEYLRNMFLIPTEDEPTAKPSKKPSETVKPTAKPIGTAKPSVAPKATPKADKDKIAFPSETAISETAAPTTAPTEPEKEARTFNDVPKENKQLTEALDYLYKKSVVNGYSGEQGNVFLPDSDITRAEIAKMLDAASENKSDGEKSYADVSESHWAYNYIKRSLYFEGYEDGSFKPEGKISYGEAVTAIVRFAGLEDRAKDSGIDYPENYIKTAAENGITGGVTVNANIHATRGDVAIMLYNAINRE